MDDQTIDRIVERIRQQLQQTARDQKPSVTIDQIEQVALELREQAGLVVAEELARTSQEQAALEHANSSKRECRGCGGTARNKGLRDKTILTMAGPLRLVRRYFYCRRCDQGFCPADDLLQPEETYTRRVQQETTRLCVLAPYNVAVDLMEQFCGVRVCVSHAQRMVERAGLAADAVLAQRLWSAEQADQQRLDRWAAAMSGDVDASPAPEISLSHLYALMDGVQTPICSGWNEMKVGVCFGVSLCGKTGPKSYVSHLGSASEFAPHLRALAVQTGVESAQQVVVLGDGAAWIWNLVDQQFPGAIQILDFWHVMDRLAKVGRYAFGEDTDAVRSWLSARDQELRQSDLKAVRHALYVISVSFPACREAVTQELGYLTNHASRMDYQRYLAQGLLIGSGAVESGCKRVVTQRLKGAGMRWAHAGAQTMARLRCLVLNQQWPNLKRTWNTQAAKQYARAV